MFHTLVVPLDGSELAERALPYAVSLATGARGELVLVRVALAPPPMGLDGADWEHQQQFAVDEAENYLRRIASTLASTVKVTTVVPYGRVAPRLLEAIQQTGADGVVMATHGRTGLTHLLFGSVAETLLASSLVPIFLVHARPGEAPATPLDPGTARVLVPLDGSTFSEMALDPAAELVGPMGELILACVVEPPTEVQRSEDGQVIAYLDQQEESRTREAREYLIDVAIRVAERYPRMRVTQDVRIGDAPHGISMAVADKAADLVVMATHGRTGVSRAVVGSVAGAVLRNAPAPLMLVGPREVSRAAELLSAQSRRT